MIQTKLFLSYALFILLSSLSGLATFWLYSHYNSINQFTENFGNLRIKIQQSITLSQRFLLYETINPEFYRGRKSEILEVRKEVIKSAYLDLEQIKKNSLAQGNNLDAKIDSMKWFLDKEEQIMKSLVEAIRLRGFKDFGIEGKMRSYAHKLEENKQVNLKILTLRRWEKDYMLRNEDIYIDRVAKEVATLKANFQSSKEIIDLLDGYWLAFKNIVTLDKTIGQKADMGLNLQLRTHGVHTEQYLKSIAQLLAKTQNEKLDYLKWIFWLGILSMFVIGLIISSILSKKLTRPLLEISGMVNTIVKKNFEGSTPIIESKSKDEIGEMTRNIGMMIREMRKNFDTLRAMNRQVAEKNDVLIEYNQKLSISEAQLKETNQIKDKFFSIIAHDLRAPFNTLKGFMSILINYVDGFTMQEIKDFIIQINSTVINLVSLTNNLLEWSLAQTEGLTVEIKDVDVRQAVENNLKLLQSTADSKDISLHNLIDIGVRMQTDENVLSFVLRNLISNGIKFTPNKGEIKIKSLCTDNQVYIQVIDSGVGMEQEVVDRLFKIGEKVTTQGTRKEKGTGLGLILCKEFLKKCNGDISVNSEVGQGSVFTFNLPISIEMKLDNDFLVFAERQD